MPLQIATVPQLVKDHPALTEGGLRWDIFNADENGLAASKAIIRKGRRVYIVVDRYFNWLDSLGSKGESVQGSHKDRNAL